MELPTMYRCALALLFVLAACAGAPGTGLGPALDGTAWTLAELRGEPALAAPEVTLAFEGDRIAGSGGVNRYFGAWSVADGRLSFGGIGATKMMGPPAAQQQEDRYFAALGEVDGASLEADRLVLTADGVAVARFARR
jgi:putative lipoprotein